MYNGISKYPCIVQEQYIYFEREKNHFECTKLTEFEFVTAVSAAIHHVHKTFCQQNRNQNKHRAFLFILYASVGCTFASDKKGLCNYVKRESGPTKMLYVNIKY